MILGLLIGRGTAFRGVIAAAVLAVLALLSACAHGPAKTQPDAGRCCAEAERQPRWLVAMIEPAAPVVGQVVGHISWRSGYLSEPGIQERIVAGLQPLDLVFVSSKGRLSGHTIPGLFQHAAIYLGTERDLQALGMWSHPGMAPHHEAIRRGAMFIEADMKGVHLSPPSVVLNTDRAVTLRPRIATRGWRQRALATLFSELGNRFDFNFDAGQPDRLFCLELACRAMPELQLPRDMVYGRETIIPDRAVYEAARGHLRLRFVDYVVGDGRSVHHPGRAALTSDIAGKWSG
ncbi:YiiX/YebB-like N1pC/P60 family cysteine hydrolase [Mesorhizobium sp. J428]|uniref:YiiX/YebB-like N1pC/P60 family cysteine hydrolase n=1 Tax=Mesorhizobium sp. J428 TaxID=2898440 RepID=UPI002150B517|nr:YiiX/YebB-like N1pC/P60 family cysteine hydrolase [Mesorhizobium sp. J428]MCR5855562.1 hypothetical protein [Mesorhizobium sp. J428]